MKTGKTCFGTLYRFELKKILCRKTTVLVTLAVALIMIAMNIGEYIAGGKIVNTEETALVGRIVDEEMLSELKSVSEVKSAVTEDGKSVSLGYTVNDRTYKPLADYLYMVCGNYEKVLALSEETLYETFDGVIDTALSEQYLTEKELDYWENRRAKNPEKLTYEKIGNSWGDSVTILYVVSLLALIAVTASLSGVFSEEVTFGTDAVVFSCRNGKKQLLLAKLAAGVTVGLSETLLLLLSCAGTEFAVSGTAGMHGSVRFFVGPTAMDMEIGKAFFIYCGIMLVIGLLFSVMAMFLSQIFKNTAGVAACMMFLWILSMLNIPDSLGLLARIWNFFPVTFLGSWTFTDYHLVPFFGKLLTDLEAAPIVFGILSVLFVLLTAGSYKKHKVK